jgi:hypothetical protein
LTFSMFALPRLLPWAGCTASSQSWEQRAVDVEDRRSSLTFSMFSLPRFALPWAGCTASSQSWEQRAVDVEDRRSSLTFSMFSLPRLLPWAGCTASSQSREQRSMSMWRTGEAPLLSRCSLCPGCFPERDEQRLRKAGNKDRCRCGGPEKLLDFLDVLFAPVASLRGMLIVFTKPGTKVDVDVEDRRSSLTFSMFSLPRLALPWAGCTESAQGRELRVVDVNRPAKL